MRITLARRTIALSWPLLVAAPFLGAERAEAQIMSKWGHPVFTFGLTPYDSVNAGHGNYPGGPGFIPGYGYYPGQGPEHYPWLDGPDMPFDRRKLTLAVPEGPGAPVVPAPVETEAVPAGAALLILQVPAEAEIWFNEAKTAQQGSYRRFVTPPLPEGRELAYTIRARWRIKDAELSRVEEVYVHPGGRFTVNFLTPDGWTGRRVGSAPQ